MSDLSLIKKNKDYILFAYFFIYLFRVCLECGCGYFSKHFLLRNVSKYIYFETSASKWSKNIKKKINLKKKLIFLKYF